MIAIIIGAVSIRRRLRAQRSASKAGLALRRPGAIGGGKGAGLPSAPSGVAPSLPPNTHCCAGADGHNDRNPTGFLQDSYRIPYRTPIGIL